MALPGGGIVSVPLECASVASSSSAAGGTMNNEETKGNMPHYQQYGSAGPSQQTAGASNNPQGGQSDVLTVAAGEPVTHFNLDQLLEIVQSFQLDTTMATHDGQETLRSARDLSLLAASSSSNKNIPSSSGCDANQPHCDILRSSSR